MKKKYAGAIIQDINNGIPVSFEFNFNEEYKDCVKVKMDKFESIIRYSDIFSMFFMVAKPEQQAQMIPVQQELGTEYMKQIRIKTTKDMKEGEELVVNVRVRVPELVEQQILKDLESPYVDNDKDKGL